MRERGRGDILVIGGGLIPDEDIPRLKEKGISAIFTAGAAIHAIAEYIRQNIKN